MNYDWDHLAKLTKDSLANASKILTKVQELEQQTHRLVSRANSARKIANHLASVWLMSLPRAL
jgi:hypothetical protein